jgi:hypothetical protein
MFADLTKVQTVFFQGGEQACLLGGAKLKQTILIFARWVDIVRQRAAGGGKTGH